MGSEERVTLKVSAIMRRVVGQEEGSEGIGGETGLHDPGHEHHRYF
jgi:hypothetical protein